MQRKRDGGVVSANGGWAVAAVGSSRGNGCGSDAHCGMTKGVPSATQAAEAQAAGDCTDGQDQVRGRAQKKGTEKEKESTGVTQEGGRASQRQRTAMFRNQWNLVGLFTRGAVHWGP
jgi:hypothetical protein